MSGVLHVEQSNGKISLFQKSSEREREKKGIEPEAWGYVKHQYSLCTRLALLLKALGVPRGNL